MLIISLVLYHTLACQSSMTDAAQTESSVSVSGDEQCVKIKMKYKILIILRFIYY